MSGDKWADSFDLCLAAWDRDDFGARCRRPDGHDGQHEAHMAGRGDVVAFLSWGANHD